ncbi:ferritin-like domain-containing protein [Paenibacillus sp. VCA1]|uniref:ferritin-like domain-containing protein n=1 Tax=Paenibacillus sp. VCA1 TaxID=3039148 RepID=UPI002871B1E3|nr:ferritin-like domain-containing protein [Paenibacillus sp. VCA1]MDR9856005.1 ferritin-like domain-containing protein [Paenibacillus sp. VCA1]
MMDRTPGSGPIAVHDLQHLIQAEYRSMIYAQRMVQLAPPEHRTYFSRHAEMKRRERLAVWAGWYYRLTACYPVFSKVEPPKDYAAGLRASIADSLDAADTYAWLLDRADEPQLQWLLQRALNGETRWSVRLQSLYSGLWMEGGDFAASKGRIGVIRKT